MSEQPDYKDTVFLPKTDFPMKAGLAQKEPGILASWEEQGLYEKLRETRKGREKFILHDGPPYANGNIHIGHALNKTLKDFVVRTQSLLGKDAPYVPGWDCHGLPIEWKIEEQYRKKKRNKDEVPTREFRQECRDYAQHWIDVQREEFKRLGVMGEWDKPYVTMDFGAEAVIVEEFLKFCETAQVYRGAKPVMWSPVEKTALAEAEVEYQDIVSTQIDVAFEIVESPIEELVGAYAVVWTTTPWTIPVNQALAYGEDIEYVLLAEGKRRFLIAAELEQEFYWRLMRVDKELGGVDPITPLSEATSPDAFRGEGGDAVGRGSVLWLGKGSDLAGTIARHPMHGFLRHSREGGNPSPEGAANETPEMDSRLRGSDEGGERSAGRLSDEAWEKAVEFYAKPRPFLPGDFVTTDAGTGLVHMAPDHGEDDFALCRKHGIDPVFAVEDDGVYRADWGWLPRGDERSGSVINKKFNAPDGPICSDLRDAGALLSASDDFQHSYPHSWRSKAKVIFRCTPQWFVRMDSPLPLAGGGQGVGNAISIDDAADEAGGPTPNPSREREGDLVLGHAQGLGPTLRETALSEIDKTRFVPERGHRRLRSMVEGRPDWVLSRQRAWGVPITLYVDTDGNYLNDPEVNARIIAAVREGGADAWFAADHQALLGNEHSLDDYEPVTDILDVWFDSGSTHAFVLESDEWPDLHSPADLYLEGSDQHRGWFQSSLLESCGTRGRAPYHQVLTHGMTLDHTGKKMSKSLGNTLDPQKIIDVNGADILRLWAATVDFTEDHRIGDEILKGVTDTYRKLRNTFRYMLGALGDFEEAERVDVAEMPELERYVLHMLAELDSELKEAVNDYAFNRYLRALTDFANEDLSAFFFDIRKDSLYCDAPGDPKRRAYRTVLDTLFHALVRYASPFLVFTAEEVWKTRFPEADSVHLLEWPVIGDRWIDGPLAAKWQTIRTAREEVTEAIEPLRREKVIRSSNEAVVTMPALSEASEALMAEIAIVAGVQFEGDEVAVSKSTDHKCGRCWRLLPEVTKDGALCDRCATVLEGQDA
ncbi:isoleucine--tRNA ligase [uncultured Parasphingopyxis sp.]|uniref:isoleucine--tRNA ligase n=1 Tax=uncultured Parasphingopyxis sp. TaxID=1547918 RepID=UPI00262FB687|nr:isoleucine--tRNA ligase [uncultured Parasphingopyxis sp.]